MRMSQCTQHTMLRDKKKGLLKQNCAHAVLCHTSVNLVCVYRVKGSWMQYYVKIDIILTLSIW